MRSIAYHAEMGAKGWVGNSGIINIPDFKVLAKNGETPDKCDNYFIIRHLALSYVVCRYIAAYAL
jgi:hypothetical protein